LSKKPYKFKPNFGLAKTLYFLELKHPQVFHYLWIFFVLIFNLSVSVLIRNSDHFFIPNPTPIGFNFGYLWSVVLFITISWLAFEFRMIHKHPVSLIFIIAGVYSNFSERLIWGSVADYMFIPNPIFEININLADIQIILGLIFLNIQVWFFADKKKETKILASS
jgi:hypothetical protein